MSTTYKIHDNDNIYFITDSIVQWVNLFDKKIFKDIIVESLNYCVKFKDLEVHAWVIMSNHIHLLVGSKHLKIDSIIRDFKKHTSKIIIKKLIEMADLKRPWMLDIFREEGRKNSNNSNYQVWQQPYYAVEIFSREFLLQKLNYIHMNPVRAEIVYNPEGYKYSSAIDYVGGKGLVEVTLI